jgi:hypothetical protein
MCTGVRGHKGAQENCDRKATKAKYRLEGETMTKSLAAMGKETKPRDVIWGLKKGTNAVGQPIVEQESKRMTEIARQHHLLLQYNDMSDSIDEERNAKIDEYLNLIDRSTTDEQREELDSPPERAKVAEAMRDSENSSAPGLDGLPFELWKHLEKIHEAYCKMGDEAEKKPSIINLMTRAFEDVWKHGVDESTNFAEGWMCPIYKKGEKDDIANYRPITCLNTDYKIFTKVMSTRTAKIAPDLIHEAQAGFVPERQISDHTQLTRMVQEYAEAFGQNSLLVALDQEKAYDKIAHDYLWRVLSKFGIPDRFVAAVRSIYKHAETKVCINRHLSDAWDVVRGVRQGDPLSCLLFDLAIKPLAIALRKSKLKGFMVPGKEERLIATLFADDTTVYLSKEDNISELEKILEGWCTASRAKFNVNKTIVMPLGKREFRRNVLRTRQTRMWGGQIPANMEILKEGQATRILGAWYRNGVDINAPWSIVVTKLSRATERWKNVLVNLLYKRHIVQCTAGGYSQYLAQVQGCPTHIENKIERQIREYLWDGRASKLNKETTRAPTEIGGLQVLDIGARNDAIKVIWLKRYLDSVGARPIWASYADALIAGNTPKAEEKLDPNVRDNVFLQTWHTFRGHQRQVHPFIRDLLSTAKEYGLRLETLEVDSETAEMMPIWLHKYASKSAHRLALSGPGKCLRGNHHINTVGEMQRHAKRESFPGHNKRKNCTCEACFIARKSYGCHNPSKCYEKAGIIANTLPPKWDPRMVRRKTETPQVCIEEGEVNARNRGGKHDNPDPVNFQKQRGEKELLHELQRIFTEGGVDNIGLKATIKLRTRPCVRVTVVTETRDTHTAKARAGTGIVYKTGNHRNTSVHVPKDMPQNNTTAALLAIAYIAKVANVGRTW